MNSGRDASDDDNDDIDANDGDDATDDDDGDDNDQGYDDRDDADDDEYDAANSPMVITRRMDEKSAQSSAIKTGTKGHVVIGR